MSIDVIMSPGGAQVAGGAVEDMTLFLKRSVLGVYLKTPLQNTVSVRTKS